MANLKDIKNRIQSVKSTQKITRAMKMVAAAKLKIQLKHHVLLHLNSFPCSKNF